MKQSGNLNELVDKFYFKTFGKNGGRDERLKVERKKLDQYGLMNVNRRKGESLPPIIRKALNYLYPVKIVAEIKPVSDYDKSLRKLSQVSFDVGEDTQKKRFRRKKRSLEDIYEYRKAGKGKSNSQEYINCIGYNGQAESEYMMTKQGIQEYTSLYNLVLQDSGLGLERIRPSKSPRKVKEKYF